MLSGSPMPDQAPAPSSPLLMMLPSLPMHMPVGDLLGGCFAGADHLDIEDETAFLKAWQDEQQKGAVPPTIKRNG